MHSELPAALLFDMDGLSVDTEPLWHEAERRVASKLGIQWSATDQEFCLGGPIEKMGRYIADRANRYVSWQVVADEVLRDVVDLIKAGFVVKPGVLNLMDQCHAHSIPIALVSASPRVVVDPIIDQLGRHRYGAVVTADDVAFTKPHPEPYLAAARALDVKIEDCIALEDSQTGATSAQAAGACVVVVPEGKSFAVAARGSVLRTLEGVAVADLAKICRHTNSGRLG